MIPEELMNVIGGAASDEECIRLLTNYRSVLTDDDIETLKPLMSLTISCSSTWCCPQDKSDL